MVHMNIIVSGNIEIIEFVSTEVLIKTPQDALDLMASSPSDYIVLHEQNFEKQFFDLKTGIAGEILQKFMNYHKKLAIIGDFKKYNSKALQDFIYESNQTKDVLFVTSVAEVKKLW